MDPKALPGTRHLLSRHCPTPTLQALFLPGWQQGPQGCWVLNQQAQEPVYRHPHPSLRTAWRHCLRENVTRV